MSENKYFTADLAVFKTSAPRVLYGEPLKRVKAMRNSIIKYGLLTPVTVIRQGEWFMVVDGHNRLEALRRLQFIGDLPQALQSIPYVIVNTVRQRRIENGQDCMPTLTNEKKYNLVMDLHEGGMAFGMIAKALYITPETARKITKVGDLCADIQAAFLGDILTLKQAHAFASIPHPRAQNKLLQMLNSHFDAPSIVRALEAGDTVLDLGNDNALVLPSRQKIGIAA
ncbi:MAG: ParB/RepB/Spo0J family partition protein [Alphaproteobacteria bacterium]